MAAGVPEDGRPRVAASHEAVALLIGALVVAAAWARLALADVTLLAQHDAIEQTWPWWLHNVTEIQNGRLPLWNPFANGGQSHIGEGQAFALYPPVMLVAWLGGTWAHTAGALHTVAFLHALLAFFGGYVVGRSASIGPVGSLVCGLTLSLGGYFSTRTTQQLNIFMATAWAPLVLAGTLRALGTGRLRWLCLSGFALAMSLLAGHAQPAYQTGVIAGGLLVAGSLLRLTPNARKLGAARCALAFMILGASAGTLGAAQLWPMVEYQNRSLRWVGADEPVPAGAPLDYATMASNASLHAGEMGSFLYQGLEKLPDDGSLYVGGAVAVLAFAGVVLSANRLRWVFAVLAALGIVVALGGATPFLQLAYYLPLNRTRAPIRWLLASHLSLAVLAGLGVDAIAGAVRRTSSITAAVLGAVVAGIGAWLAWPHLSPWTGRVDLAIGAGAAAATIAIIVWRGGRPPTLWPALAVSGLVAAELGLSMAAVFLPRPAERPTSVESYLRSQPGHFRFANWDSPELENLGVLIRRPSLSGFGATRPTLVHEFQKHVYPHSWDLAGVRFLTLGPSAPSLGREDLREVANLEGTRVLENAKAFPLAWLVGAVRVADDSGESLKFVAESDFDSRASAIVLRADLDRVSHVTGPAAGTVEILEYEPGLVRMRIKTPTPALLVTSEPDYPGWMTTIDGADASAINVNFAFRGVAVDAGDHTVTFDYHPRSVFGGIWISLGAAVLLGLWLLVRR